MTNGIVIVGAGQAGARTAAALRRRGFEGAITLIGEEPALPYERPPLSKAALAPDAAADIGRLYPREFYADNRIDLILGAHVDDLDAGARRIRVDGSALRFDKLVLATGARARSLAIPGLAPESILSLRSAGDAATLKPLLGGGRRLLVIGGGFIGLELAASAIRLGCAATVVEAAPRVLARCVGPTTSDMLLRFHRARGADILLDASVRCGEATPSGHVVTLADGTRVQADIVVAGIGAIANDDLALAAGLACRAGVVTDAAGRTAHPDLFAVGDVSLQPNRWADRSLRLESWENAERQPTLCAAALLGEPVDDDHSVPWFWTDQHDLNLQILGFPTAELTMVRREGPAANASVNLYVDDTGAPRAAELFNSGRDRRFVKQMIERRAPIDARAFADAARPLKTLASA